MSPILIAVIVLFLALAAAVAVYLVRSSPPQPPAEVSPAPEESPADHDARIRELEERGTELLQRRVELDARRGTLGGQSQIYDAFEDLEARLRAGEISEDQFEREKIRLLEGH